MKSSSPTSLPHHFLFMLPESTTPDEHEQVVKAAKELTAMGYVYVASTQERTMEDRDNIRFMPLKSDDLPRFGSVSGVMVVRDQKMAQVAEEAYPGAKIMVIDPAPAALTAPDSTRALRRASGPVWHPLMGSSSVPHAA
jgi:hypothetical protein